jgi:hypothetical protein
MATYQKQPIVECSLAEKHVTKVTCFSANERQEQEYINRVDWGHTAGLCWKWRCVRFDFATCKTSETQHEYFEKIEVLEKERCGIRRAETY